jgi:hypothetical protein
MSICASGSSVAKPGVPAGVVVDQGYVQSLLPPVLSWLYPYLPYMHALEIGNVASFCAADPPSWSLPLATQFLAFLTGSPLADVLAVNGFLTNITSAYLWNQLCTCSSGAAPPPPTAPSDPGGLPALNPPVAVGPGVNAGCGTYQSDQVVPFANGDWTNLLGAVVVGTDAPVTSVPLPAGATKLHWVASHPHVNDPLSGSVTQLQFTAAGANIAGGSSLTFAAGFGGDHTADLAVPATATGFTLACSSSNSAHPDPYPQSGLVTFYCGNNPGTTAAPCCPPDPIMTGLLSRILQMVTLQQRQTAPFAYVPGPIHSGLTGEGFVSVQGILAALAVITAMPPGLSDDSSTPSRTADLGWINFGTDDGYDPPLTIQSASQFCTPALPGVYTKIGYSMKPGITLELRELVREP